MTRFSPIDSAGAYAETSLSASHQSFLPIVFDERD